jgi:hypothetical protein
MKTSITLCRSPSSTVMNGNRPSTLIEVVLLNNSRPTRKGNFKNAALNSTLGKNRNGQSLAVTSNSNLPRTPTQPPGFEPRPLLHSLLIHFSARPYVRFQNKKKEKSSKNVILLVARLSPPHRLRRRSRSHLIRS